MSDNMSLAYQIVSIMGSHRQIEDCVAPLGMVLTAVLSQVPADERMPWADAFCQTLRNRVRDTLT